MKCPNCGAEVGSGTDYCPFCRCEMPKEKQEIHITNNYYSHSEPEDSVKNSETNSVCSKCGSSKIKFKREEIGSTNAKSNKGKREVHYRTVAICQDCGNTWTTDKEEAKKKHGFWWWAVVVLFWPISIAYFLSKWVLTTTKFELKKTIRIAIVVVIWILAFVVIFSIGSSGDEESTTEETTVEEIIESSEERDEEKQLEYADDEVVNRFIQEFNEKTEYSFTDITKGNIRTKYYGTANNRRIEMINANENIAECFSVSINSSIDENADNEMFDVFRASVSVLEPSVSSDDVEKAIAEFIEKQVLVENYELGDTLTVTFVPTKDLSNGKSIGRIDISASNYK